MSYNLYPWYTNYNDQVPNHWQSKHRNNTLQWAGSDQQDLFQKNLQDSNKLEMLTKGGWLEPIEYIFNNHGFRSEAFDDRPAGLALGCSCTQGVGLHVEQVWPSILSKKLNLKVWNMGIGAAAFDTVFRILDYYLLKFNPKFVCILMPPVNRFEYCDIYNRHQVVLGNSKIEHSTFAKEWFTQEVNGIINRKKNMLAVQQLCHKADVPLFIEDSMMGFDSKHKDYARDLMHYGVNSQNHIANKFYQQMSEHHGI